MSEAKNHPPASSVTALRYEIKEDDWSIEIDANHVDLGQDGLGVFDWMDLDKSIEIDADHVDLGQDGLGVFDWSEEADNAPVALALMATSLTDSSNSELG
ncbi:hypothetical protein Tco_0275273 [Tanacetum coccineum]